MSISSVSAEDQLESHQAHRLAEAEDPRGRKVFKKHYQIADKLLLVVVLRLDKVLDLCCIIFGHPLNLGLLCHATPLLTSTPRRQKSCGQAKRSLYFTCLICLALSDHRSSLRAILPAWHFYKAVNSVQNFLPSPPNNHANQEPWAEGMILASAFSSY